MTTSGYKFVCDFKDSIKTDEETERKQDIQDLNLGILRPEEYRAKWMGEDIDTALQNLPQKAEVIEWVVQLLLQQLFVLQLLYWLL